MIQSENTQKFKRDVKSLIKSGIVKKHQEIIDALEWDKTTFSRVMNGFKDVPAYIQAKFNEVYQLSVTEPDEIRLSLLIKINAKSDVILSVLAEVLANQNGSSVAKINDELVAMVNDRVVKSTKEL